jgi:hypothetical protein
LPGGSLLFIIPFNNWRREGTVKKLFCLTVLSLVVAALTLGGCKKKEENVKPEDVSKKANEAVSKANEAAAGAADAAKGMADSMKKAFEKK